MSKFTKVENKNAYRSSDPDYWHIRCSEVDYLFPTSQLEIAFNRAQKNQEDLPLPEIEVIPTPEPEPEPEPMPEIEVKPAEPKSDYSGLIGFVVAVLVLGSVVAAAVYFYNG